MTSTPSSPKLPELKPCPFCGEEADHLHIYAGEEIVRCSNGKCAVNPMAGGGTESEVASRWNTRAKSDETVRLSDAQASIQALEADAARYRWLRNRLPGSAYRIAGVIYSEGGQGVDAAIDAARAAQEVKG